MTKTVLFSIIVVVAIILGIAIHFYDKKLIRGIKKHEEMMEKRGFLKDILLKKIRIDKYNLM